MLSAYIGLVLPPKRKDLHKLGVIRYPGTYTHLFLCINIHMPITLYGLISILSTLLMYPISNLGATILAKMWEIL